jgi:hypothetical protein
LPGPPRPDQTIGGVAYNLGHFGLDAFSSVTGKSASTSDDDIFGTFKII